MRLRTGWLPVSAVRAVRSMDVSFESGAGRLAGTFTEAADPVAAALVLPGSGKTDRNTDSRLPGGQVLRGGVTRAVAEVLDLITGWVSLALG